MGKVETIYLAGGCFWGVEAFFQRIEGIVNTEVGYANGYTNNPTYESVCKGDTHFAETVKVEFDPAIISLKDVLLQYFKIIDPISFNRQGGDIGSQYRTGIYYTTQQQRKTGLEVIGIIQHQYSKLIVVEVVELKNYFVAEGYHQSYLKNNPNGYCHVDLSLANKN